MAGYVGTVGARVELVVTLMREYSYETTFGYRSTTTYIYTMEDAEGHAIVWKTTTPMHIDGEDKRGNWCPYLICKGDRIVIKATVKDHGSYRDEEQTEVQRVKVLEVVEKAEDVRKAQAARQQATIGANDLVWRMPYSQYKDHYADCETVLDSYDSDASTIEVIIREGRLKASGVRFQHFDRYVFANENGERIIYTAVSRDNALRRAQREHPDHTWEYYTMYKGV